MEEVIIIVALSNEEDGEARYPERREARVCHESAPYLHLNVVSIVRKLHISEVGEFVFFNTWVSANINTFLALSEIVGLSPPDIA